MACCTKKQVKSFLVAFCVAVLKMATRDGNLKSTIKLTIKIQTSRTHTSPSIIPAKMQAKMQPREFQVVDPTLGISCHAWNHDRSMLAVCPNDNTLVIWGNCLAPLKSAWVKLFTLSEHDLLLTSIDWSPLTNLIVTCSHDRNAFVWTYSSALDKWEPSLVILRIDRAALDVKWSPDGKKFAVASGSKCVPICYFESEHNWWVSKMIKKHKSTVLSLAWHPCSQLIGTGSSDFKARVFSAYVPTVDSVQISGPFGTEITFAEEYKEYSSLGWVDSVAFSPSGATFAYTGHDSSISFVNYGKNKENAEAQTIRFKELPIHQVVFLNEDTLVGVGHEMNPLIFTQSATGVWKFTRKLEQPTLNPAPTPIDPKIETSAVQRARSLFQSKTMKGQEKTEIILETTHESCITCVKKFQGGGFSTSGMDGKIVLWIEGFRFGGRRG